MMYQQKTNRHKTMAEIETKQKQEEKKDLLKMGNCVTVKAPLSTAAQFLSDDQIYKLWSANGN